MRHPKVEVMCPATGMPMNPRRSPVPVVSNPGSALALGPVARPATSWTFWDPWSMPASIRSPIWVSPVAARARAMTRSNPSAAARSRPTDILVAIALMNASTARAGAPAARTDR